MQAIVGSLLYLLYLLLSMQAQLMYADSSAV